MTDNQSEVPEGEAAELVRPYVITRGRDLSGAERFSLITLVTTADDQRQRPNRLSPEEQQLVELCTGGYLSVAEIAGHAQLPLGVVKILLSSLADAGYLISRAPVPRAQRADVKILQEVLNGLQSRLG